MIIKLFNTIGKFIAWILFSVLMAQLVVLAVVCCAMSESLRSAIEKWTWPNPYIAFCEKITGIKI